jgi:hypothetical protein
MFVQTLILLCVHFLLFLLEEIYLFLSLILYNSPNWMDKLIRGDYLIPAFQLKALLLAQCLVDANDVYRVALKVLT